LKLTDSKDGLAKNFCPFEIKLIQKMVSKEFFCFSNFALAKNHQLFEINRFRRWLAKKFCPFEIELTQKMVSKEILFLPFCSSQKSSAL
jgi:uncharacterized membrane protein YkgB